MRTASPGRLYACLTAAASRKGSARSIYGPENTLSRRGLLTRADRRARELQGLGIGQGDLVALSLGNTTDLVVMLLSCSKLGAIAVPLDPGRGERLVARTAQRLPLRAVVRRPRGLLAPTPDYGEGYRFTARRRLTGSRLALDVLHPPAACLDGWSPPPGAELVTEARGLTGAPRDLVRTGEQLLAQGTAVAEAMGLHPGARLLCTQPLVVPRLFEPVVLGWLASEAQLVMAEGSLVDAVLPRLPHLERLVVVDALRELLALARAARARTAPLPLTPVVAQARADLAVLQAIAPSFTEPPRQLLQLEELGLVAHRGLDRGGAFHAAAGVTLRPGAAMQIGGHELLASLPHPVHLRPPVPPTEPGALADDPFRHTGYAARFGPGDALLEVLGRDDGLVDLDGRRACLDHLEVALLAHRRLTWVHAHHELDPDGDAWLWVEYRATGRTPVDDLEEHAIGRLPPFMVPRRFERLDDTSD